MTDSDASFQANESILKTQNNDNKSSHLTANSDKNSNKLSKSQLSGVKVTMAPTQPAITSTESISKIHPSKEYFDKQANVNLFASNVAPTEDSELN